MSLWVCAHVQTGVHTWRPEVSFRGQLDWSLFYFLEQFLTEPGRRTLTEHLSIWLSWLAHEPPGLPVSIPSPHPVRSNRELYWSKLFHRHWWSKLRSSCRCGRLFTTIFSTYTSPRVFETNVCSSFNFIDGYMYTLLFSWGLWARLISSPSFLSFSLIFDLLIITFTLAREFLSLISIAVINSMTKSDLGRKGLFNLTLPDHSPSMREVRARSLVEAEAKTVEECCLLACSPWFASSPFLSYNPGALTQGWYGPYQSFSRDCPTDFLPGQCDGGTSSIEVLSSQICIGLCSVDKN